MLARAYAATASERVAPGRGGAARLAARSMGLRRCALVPDRPDVPVKHMFANVVAFVTGNAFIGPFGSAVAALPPKPATAPKPR